ncbi:MAG: ribonuclease HII [Candidatus Buchananbacteria bacterium]
MKQPTKKLEQQLFKQGYNLVCGLDEVGRGAWAGPIVAGATIIENVKLKIISPRLTRLGRESSGVRFAHKLIRDSKKLNHEQRVKAAAWLKENIIWGIGQVESWEIDAIGLGAANILAMRRAVAKLKIKPDYFLVDGPHLGKNFFPSQSIIAGDAKVWCIAAASIIAKVYRDDLMKQLHQQYPQYGFASHVGYGTKQHQQALKKYGAIQQHRQSYRPIKNLKVIKKPQL